MTEKGIRVWASKTELVSWPERTRVDGDIAVNVLTDYQLAELKQEIRSEVLDEVLLYTVNALGFAGHEEVAQVLKQEIERLKK